MRLDVHGFTYHQQPHTNSSKASMLYSASDAVIVLIGDRRLQQTACSCCLSDPTGVSSQAQLSA
jgi:hypothetical protein